MPNRFVSVVILVVWTYLTLALLRHDVLPGLLIGPPPDLRAAVRAEGPRASAVRWSILVADDAEDLDLRAVGQARTESRRSSDGWVKLASRTWFDSGELLRGTPLGSRGSERIEVHSHFDVRPSGDLESFRIGVRLSGWSSEVLAVTGQVEHDHLVVSSRGPLPMLDWTRTFPYQPRALVQDALGPLEWMPGLQVGQTWTSRVISPLTGRVEEVAAAVERRRVMTWDGNPTTTFEVVGRFGPMAARTWVRPDGLVLRQEVPFPFVRLLLERMPDEAPPFAGHPDTAKDSRP